MMRSIMYFAFAAALCGGFARADESELRQILFSEDGWVGYQVPMIVGAGSPCCYSGNVGGVFSKKACNLDVREGSTISKRSASGSPSELSVYWHVLDGKPDQVRAYAADCPIKSQAPIRWIKPVKSRDSIAAFTNWIEGQDSGHDEESGLAALALHADPLATKALIGFAGSARGSEMREHAVFWLGQARGKSGADFVEKVATTDPNSELREHAIFSLSESGVSDAYERILSISKRDASAEVRSKAYFWMAQMKDPRAQADILAALYQETSEDARDQAVFALSQLGNEAATSALIAIVRGNYPRTVKEKALFWLGQSGTDEAMAFLDSMLTK